MIEREEPYNELSDAMHFAALAPRNWRAGVQIVYAWNMARRIRNAESNTNYHHRRLAAVRRSRRIRTLRRKGIDIK
jgi:hypothetical protein